MNIKTYNSNTQISKHTNSSEIRCQHCGVMKIDLDLINKIETLFSKLKCSKYVISSGYRCPVYDRQIGGFEGQHSKGLAIDCCFYDKDGYLIPAKIICCVANDLGFKGIAKIDDYYVHLDNRQNGNFKGDETRGNDNYWTNPYSYFGVSEQDIYKYTGDIKVNVYYRVKTEKNGWLPEVTNLNDYAGYKNVPITDIAIRVDKGSIKYRVAPKGKNFLPYVTGYNINDHINGYAGNGKPIDRIEAYYYTPSNIRPLKKAKYKVNDFDYQYDNETSSGQDGYAGLKGTNITKFQIVIE